jgi:hypothetical protein
MQNFTTEQHTYLIDFFTQEALHNRDLAHDFLAQDDAELADMYLRDAEQCDAVVAKLSNDTTIATAKQLVREFDTYEDLLTKISEFDERDDIVDLLTQ